MNLLSHPFRLEASGSVATVEDGTDEAAAEAIAVLVLTRQGERDLVPGYGLPDPTFGDVDVSELNVLLTDYAPGITVTEANVTALTDTTESLEIVFDTTEDLE